jgi:hypothetical protein
VFLSELLFLNIFKTLFAFLTFFGFDFDFDIIPNGFTYIPELFLITFVFFECA